MLRDKVVWVTGASRGIGKATATLLASEGAKVIISGRSTEGLQETCNEIKQLNLQEAYTLSYDVKDKEAIKDAFLHVKKKFQRLDVMVNNAGILGDSLLGMVNENLIQDTFQTNTYAVIYHMQYASRFMQSKKRVLSLM